MNNYCSNKLLILSTFNYFSIYYFCKQLDGVDLHLLPFFSSAHREEKNHLMWSV